VLGYRENVFVDSMINNKNCTVDPFYIKYFIMCRNHVLDGYQLLNTDWIKSLFTYPEYKKLSQYTSKYIKFISLNNAPNKCDIDISKLQSESDIIAYINDTKYQITDETIIFYSKMNESNIDIILFLLQSKIIFTEEIINKIICHTRFESFIDKILYTIQNCGYEFTKLNFMYMFNSPNYTKIFALIDTKNLIVDDDVLAEILKAKIIYGKLSTIMHKIRNDKNKSDENIRILFCITAHSASIKSCFKIHPLNDRMKEIINKHTKLKSIKKITILDES
jgi:hypothetical protein